MLRFPGQRSLQLLSSASPPSSTSLHPRVIPSPFTLTYLLPPIILKFSRFPTLIVPPFNPPSPLSSLTPVPPHRHLPTSPLIPFFSFSLSSPLWTRFSPFPSRPFIPYFPCLPAPLTPPLLSRLSTPSDLPFLPSTSP